MIMLSLTRNYLRSASKVLLISQRSCLSVETAGKKFKLNEKYNKIGFIGTGNMARAIIAGLISKDKYKPEEIYVTDSDLEYVEYLKNEVPLFKDNGINFVSSIEKLLKETKTIMICVKPQDMKRALTKNATNISENHLVLSIAAGTEISQIEGLMKNKTRVIRIMTNTAALIQQSCSVYAKGLYASDEDALFVADLLESIGACEGEVNEDIMDVVTALAGSGPAYMFLILDALADGAVKMGLDRQTAIRLATQTMIGSSKMVISELNKTKGGKDVQQLRVEVCSPGGTTLEGIKALKNAEVTNALVNCIRAATDHAAELSAIELK
jgi:pyrroline-5-carboxylate reductase